MTLSSKLQRKKNDSRQYPSLPRGSTHKSLSPAIQFIRDLDASFILAPSKGLQLALRQRKWLHRLVPAEVLQPLFLHAFAMSHLFTNLRCIPLSVLLALIGGVLLVGSSGMETLKNFAYRPYIADILAVLKIVGSPLTGPLPDPPHSSALHAAIAGNDRSSCRTAGDGGQHGIGLCPRLQGLRLHS